MPTCTSAATRSRRASGTRTRASRTSCTRRACATRTTCRPHFNRRVNEILTPPRQAHGGLGRDPAARAAPEHRGAVVARSQGAGAGGGAGLRRPALQRLLRGPEPPRRVHYLADPIPADSTLSPEARAARAGRRGLHVGRVRIAGEHRLAALAAGGRRGRAAVVAGRGARRGRHVPAPGRAERATGPPGHAARQEPEAHAGAPGRGRRRGAAAARWPRWWSR